MKEQTNLHVNCVMKLISMLQNVNDTDIDIFSFLIPLKQRTIHRVSYNLFKHADKSSTMRLLKIWLII